MVSGHEMDISEDLPAKEILNMLTFRGAPSGKSLEAWREHFSLKVGVVRIRALISKKYHIGKEGARARAPQIWAPGPKSGPMGPKFGPLGPKFGPWAQIWAQGRRFSPLKKKHAVPLDIFLS